MILSVIIHKYLNIVRSIRVRVERNIKIRIVYRLMIAVLPGRIILQGGLSVAYIILVGVVYGFMRNWVRFKIYKIVPTCPIIIIPVIILIELIRYLIRPISLILRIIINLTIGHIVIYILRYPFTAVYSLIEIFIYCIQVYIFWTLISIYSK